MPYLGSTAFVVTLLAVLGAAFVATWLAVRALAPRFAARATERFTVRPVLSTVLGVAVGGGASVVLAALSAAPHPALKAIAGVGLAALALIGLVGAVGVAGRVGEGLASPTDAGREWFRTLKGGVVVVLCLLLPFAGWLVLLPLSLLAGVGLTLSSLALALLGRPVPEGADAAVGGPRAEPA